MDEWNDFLEEWRRAEQRAKEDEEGEVKLRSIEVIGYWLLLVTGSLFCWSLLYRAVVWAIHH